jgi:hypothetical protein
LKPEFPPASVASVPSCSNPPPQSEINPAPFVPFATFCSILPAFFLAATAI